MATIKITLEEKVSKEIEIELPAFFRSPDGIEYIAVLSETDYREVWELKEMLLVKARSAADCHDAISAAVKNYERISEVEFFTRWDEALESLSLTPKLKP